MLNCFRMEEWQLDFEWLETRHKIKEIFKVNALPDLRVVLFLIGVQELGQGFKDFTKEEKTDLIHIAVCTLMEADGFYKFAGRDVDGWPHWEVKKPFKTKGIKEQEKLLKKYIIDYFKSDS